MDAREKSRARMLNPDFDRYRREGLRKSLETRAAAPKCGAKCRSTGEPCTQPVREEGKRCRYHGGATPSGSNWHRRQFPKKGAATSRVRNKLLALEVRDRKARQRREAMSDEERAEHEKRQRSARPGTLAERQRAQQARKVRAELQELTERPPSPEAQRLAAEIERLEAKAAAHPRIDLDDPDNLPEIFQ